MRRNAVQNVSASWADIKPEDLARSVAVDADRNNHGDQNDAAGLAYFDVGGVDPQI